MKKLVPMKVERETGLANVILREKTVILDFVETDGSHTEHYHRYKTREKAEAFYQIYSTGKNHYEMITRCNRCNSRVTAYGVSRGYKFYCPECDEDLYDFETHTEYQ